MFSAFSATSCPECHGRGEVVTAYICFGPNPRHETMKCFSCEGSGSLESYILNRLEKDCHCVKHRKYWGNLLFDIGMKHVMTRNRKRIIGSS